MQTHTALPSPDFHTICLKPTDQLMGRHTSLPGSEALIPTVPDKLAPSALPLTGLGLCSGWLPCLPCLLQLLHLPTTTVHQSPSSAALLPGSLSSSAHRQAEQRAASRGPHSFNQILY